VCGKDIDGDGVPEMICGAIDSCVYAFRRSGELLWEFLTGEEISAIAFADLNGDSIPETIAGSMNGYVYALDAQGQEIWHRGLGEEINSIAVLPHENELQIVVGTDGPMIYVLNAQGHINSAIDSGSPLRTVLARSTLAGMALYGVHRRDRVTSISVSRRAR
jgi:outer membrane protein assembly factor BamB